MTTVPRPQANPRAWLRAPRSARLRLTALHSALVLLLGATLLTITYLLFEQTAQQTGVVRTLTPHGGPPPASINETQRSEFLGPALHAAAAAQSAADKHNLLIVLGIALAIVSALALLLGWFFAGRMLRPVRTITATARRISASSLNERLALEDADEEFKQLGGALDDLFARLQRAFEAQQHFVANASHELRTPLTAERTLLQVALDDPETTNATWRSTAKELLVANVEQEQLIEALLALASSESNLDHHEPIDLAVLADSVLLDYRSDAEQRQIEITAAIEPAPITGQPALVERLLANLIDNAVRYNAPGGHVHVQTTATADGDAQLLVTNTGPEIPPMEVERLFEPFQRLKTGRTNGQRGYGLGLSIVRAIITAHHAQLTARPRPDGGLEIRVSFPSTARRR